MRRRASQVALGAAILVAPRGANAQVRWDAELEVGAMRRVLTSKPAGGEDAGFGPLLEASAHIALVPLLRVGLYAHFDSSPVSTEEAREIYAGGLDVRVVLPWMRGAVRGYVRFGVGEAGTYAAGHSFLGVSPSRGLWFVPSSHGHFTEVPLAVGALYRLEPGLSLDVEAGTRVAFGFAGSAYDTPSISPGEARIPSGDDTVAVFVSAGVQWGR